MFSEKIPVQDPITGMMVKKHLKPYMVTQLSILIERNNLILSPYDSHIFKQLIDYRIEKITQSGVPVYTSVNEHFVDALGLAYLAFVQNFPELTNLVKEAEHRPCIKIFDKSPLASYAKKDLDNPWDSRGSFESPDEAWQKVPMNEPLISTKKKAFSKSNWFKRSMF